MLDKVSGFISRHGFGVFVAVAMMAELLGFNPYSPLRDIRAMGGTIQLHEETSKKTVSELEQIKTILLDQARSQQEAALLACLRASKNDSEREECVRKLRRP